MSKRTTSLLVLLAVVLLALPTQAQTFAKKQARSKGQVTAMKGAPLKVNDVKKAKAAKQKAERGHVKGKAFRTFFQDQSQAAQSTQLSKEQALVLKANTTRTADKAFKTWNWAAHQTPKFVSKSGLVKTDPRTPVGQFTLTHKVRDFEFNKVNTTSATPSRRAGEMVDAHGIITAPYVADFSTEAPMGDFSVIDNNQDTYSWGWSSGWGAFYSFSSEFDADDYLILPINLEAGKTYDVTVTARVAGSYYPEKFSVVAGTTGTPEGLTTTVIAETEITNTDAADYTGTLAIETAGTYYVAIHATSDADMFRLMVDRFAIEEQAAATAPGAPTDFNVTMLEDVLGAKVDLKAPTTTIGGDALAAGDIAKIELKRDGKTINTFTAPAPGAALSYTDNASDLTIGVHKYQAYAYGTEGVGGKTEEIAIFLTAALNPPYTFDFSDGISFDLFMVIDNNNDGTTWEGVGNSAYYEYNSDNAADDYLVSVPFNLVEGKNYNVIVNALANSSSYPERFEVLVGTKAEVASLTQTVIPATEVTNTVAEDFEGQFSVAADGKYYIAVHAISDADMWSLLVNSITVEPGADPSAPEALPNFTATAGAEGALEVNLKFDIPYNTIKGESLSGPINVNIYRDGTLIHTEANCSLGSTQTWKDTNVENGTTYTYYVVGVNDWGEGLKSEKKKVFVGTDELDVIENIQVTGDTQTTVSLSWDAATGINGGFVGNNIIYDIYSIDASTGELNQKLGSVTNATSGTFNYDVDAGEQGYAYFTVIASNDGGATYTDWYDYTYLLTGAPYDLPIVEGFEGSTLHYIWDYSANGGLYVSNESSDDDGVSLLFTSFDYDPAQFISGKLNLNNVPNATLVFDVKSDYVTSINVLGRKDGGAWQTLKANIAVSGEFATVKVPIASIKGERYSQVAIEAQFADPSVDYGFFGVDIHDNILIDNIRLVDLLQYDLAIAVSAPSKMQQGQKGIITATVKNEGENAANGYKVTVKANDKKLFEETANQALEPFKSIEYAIDLEASIFEEAGDVTITAEVSFANDLNPDNDKAETIVSISETGVAIPEWVSGTQTDEGIRLSWSAPSDGEGGTAEVTEDFTSYENGADETGELGEWTLINANGYTKGGIFQSTPLASDGLVRAWQVFNLATYGGDNAYFAGPDGSVDNNYLISTYNLEGQTYPGNDDWLISPELSGVAQTIKFNVRAFNDYGPQTYQVLYSTTGKAIEDFTLIEEVADGNGTWSEVSYDLPAGTKYFAIRNVTGGDPGFILAIDDLTYLVGGASVASYNIYVDGVLVANVSGDVTTYIIDPSTISSSGNHEFSISAVYSNGAESKPVTVTVNVVTAIEQIAQDGKPVDVYSLDGRLVRQQAKSLDGLKGVYVINGRTVIVK